MSGETHGGADPGTRFARLVYRWRIVSTLVVLALVVGLFVRGIALVGSRTNAVVEIADVSDGRGSVEAQIFDPSLDVWFAGDNDAIATYDAISDRFIAEDYLLVSFEVADEPRGVFEPHSLATIARLTDDFLKIPGVRHVRSLTHNPWIRWGAIDDTEEGLIISDLVEQDPATLSDRDIAERMVAILGAEAAVGRLGEGPVREVIGPGADFEDFIGEPQVLGTLVNDAGTTTAIQIQVTRPFFTEQTRNKWGLLATKLHSVHYQRAALRATEHILRREAGLVIPTEEFQALSDEVDALPRGPEKDALQRQLRDPTTAFVADLNGAGALVQKYHEYERDADGGWVDRLSPDREPAPAGFSPSPVSPYEYHLAGVPTFERNFEIVGKADAGLLPLTLLVIFISLFAIFRNLVSAVVPMIVVAVSIIGTVGGLFFSANLFNNLTAMTPTMMTVVGVADAVHLVAAYLMLRASFSSRSALVIEVVRRNALPVFLTSVTTAAGFYSLMLIDLQPVRQLAWMMGLGSLLAYAVTMTLVPLLLSLLPITKAGAARRPLIGLFSKARSEAFAGWVTRRKGPILTGAVLMTVFTFAGLSRIEINNDLRAFFPPENPVMVHLEWIEDRLGGAGDLELVFSAVAAAPATVPLNAEEAGRLEGLRVARLGFESGLPGFGPLSGSDLQALEELEESDRRWRQSQIGVSVAFLEQLDGFETRLRSEMVDPDSPLNFVTDLVSPLDILRKMHQVQNENRAAYYRTPTDEDVHPDSRTATLSYDDFQQRWWLVPGQDASTLVAQYYLQYELGARPGENLASQMSQDRQHFRMQGRVRLGNSNDRTEAYRRIVEIAEEEFPALAGGGGGGGGHTVLATLSVSGKTVLQDQSGLVIAHGYTRSLAVALAVISALIGLVFRSVRYALMSLLPNVFPILVPLGILGMLGIPLDGPAIVACSIALGVCVDDTIHLFSRFREAERKGLSSEAAIGYAIAECGNALTITSIVLVLGFSVLFLSDFSPNFYIGALGTTMITLAWAADFLVTPAVLAVTHRGGRVHSVQAQLETVRG